MASDITPPSATREKVALKAGFHLTDWVRRTQAMPMRSKFGLPRITLEELSLHNTEGDCWTAYQGKVYNITDYLHYHPGGVKKLMLGAGKDCTELFDRYHRWVNCDAFLGKFCVGILSDRPAVIAEVESGIDGLSDDDSYDALDKAASTTTKGKSALEDPDQDDV